MKKLILLFSFLAAPLIHAEVTSLTFAANIKSFNKTHVVCESNKVEFKVKREAIAKKELHEGDTVLVIVPGRDLASIFEKK